MDKKLRELRDQYKFISQNEFELAVNLFFRSGRDDEPQTHLFEEEDYSHYYICENMEKYVLKGKKIEVFHRKIGQKIFRMPPKFLNRAPYFGIESQLNLSCDMLVSYVCNGVENSRPTTELLMHLSPVEIISLLAMSGRIKEGLSYSEIKSSSEQTKCDDFICTLISEGFKRGIKDSYHFSLISDKKAPSQGLVDRVEQVTHNLIPFLQLQEFKESLKEERFNDYSGLSREKQLINIYSKLRKLDLTAV